LGLAFERKIAKYIIWNLSIGAGDDGDIQMRQELAGIDVLIAG